MKVSVLMTLVLTVSAGIAVAAGDPAAGKAVYDKTCKTCHGATGTANPNIAKMMKVDIKDLGSPEIQKMSDADFKSLQTNAIPSLYGVIGFAALNKKDSATALLYPCQCRSCGVLPGRA